MNKLNCNVVRDILPLYTDEVVCEDTRNLVEAHLSECEDCRRELTAMREKIVIPIQTDVTNSMKKVRSRWGRKQLWKGVSITLVCVYVLLAAFILFCQNGIPAQSEDILLVTGLECIGVSMGEEVHEELGWDRFFQWGERHQQWIIHMETTDGSHLIVDHEVVMEENAEGEKITSHSIYRVKTLPAFLAEEYEYQFNTASYQSFHDISESGDCFVTIIFADKEITFSMKDEGLWDTTKVHESTVCPDCWGQRAG